VPVIKKVRGGTMGTIGISFGVKVVIIAIVIIVAAICGTLAYFYLSPRGEEEVRIGALLSLTGSLAPIGEPSAFSIKLCIEDINKLGGLTLGERKLPVKLIAYDTSSDPSKCSALAEQLILQDKVHVVLSNPGPPTIQIPVCLVADKLKVPALVGTVMEPLVASGPFNYAWGIGAILITPIPEGDFRAGKPGYAAILNFLGFTNIYRDKINGRIALFAPDDAEGRVWYDLVIGVLQEAGYTIVGVDKRLGQYAPGTKDFTAIIREWRDAGADVLWGSSDVSDFATMWRQAKMLGWKPKMAMDGRAVKNYDDTITIGKEIAIGLVDPWNVWNPYIPYTSYYGGRTNMQLSQEWTRETGKPWTDCLSAYSFVEVACQAIELAESLEPEKINKALSQLDIMTMCHGRVRFIPEFHYCGQALYVGQWVVDKNGDLRMEIVHSPNPDLQPTHEPIFPLPE
jgi:branched-chain amino acid transport system substrate-binding protein